LKGGEEKSLIQFQLRLKKEYKKQIKIREEEIEDLIEQIEEATEELEIASLSPDLEQIKTNDSRKAYFETFNDMLEDKIDAIKKIEGKKDKVEKAISNFKYKLSLIS
jgi:hypothetical protein